MVVHSNKKLKNFFFYLTSLSFLIKKIFSLFFLFSPSGFSSFFLFPFLFFSLSLSLSSPLCFIGQRPHLPKPISLRPYLPKPHRRSILLDLHFHRRIVLGLSPVYAGFVSRDPSRPRCRPILPSSPSHRSPNANKPSPISHCRSKLHCRPKLHHRSKLHQHHLNRTQKHCEIDQGRNEAEEFGFGGVARFHGFCGGGLARFRRLVVVWLCWW